MKMADYQPFSKLTSHTAEQAYDKVLEYAGASLRRDVIDQRIVREVKNGIGIWSSCHSRQAGTSLKLVYVGDKFAQKF